MSNGYLATFSSFFILSMLKEKYFTYVHKFVMEDYWISSLLGFAFGDNTFIAKCVIATVLYSYCAI